MIDIKRIYSNDDNYSFVEKLLESSFPIDERRDNDLQKAYTDEKSNFNVNVILLDGNIVGLINYWDLGEVYYIEHFAIDPLLRGNGIGEQTLKRIKSILSNKPIILEAETPIDEMQKRRINFYSRNEFQLYDIEYKQPPYRKDGGCIDMNILTYNWFSKLDINQVINELYRQVYNYTKVF